jgi:hypothetical protein
MKNASSDQLAQGKVRTLQVDEDLTWLVRPRDIRRAFGSDITYYTLRKLREAGLIRARRARPDGNAYYIAEEIAKAFGFPLEPPKPVEPPTPLPGLLRLRDIRKRIGFCRDGVEDFVKAGEIKPFLKCAKAKALYPTWQLLRNIAAAGCRISLATQPEPAARWLRRRIVTKWLGVTATELESWVQLELIRRADGYYDKEEIKQKILGLTNV